MTKQERLNKIKGCEKKIKKLIKMQSDLSLNQEFISNSIIFNQDIIKRMNDMVLIEEMAY